MPHDSEACGNVPHDGERFRTMANDAEGPIRVRAWSESFLSAKTRGRRGPLRWLQVPVKLTDPDYVAIASSPDGAATLGVWLAVLELAGTLEARDGCLSRSNGDPLMLSEIAAATRLDVETLARGIENLQRVGWLLGAPISETFGTVRNDSEPCGTVPNDSAKVRKERRGGEGRGEEVLLAGSPPAPRGKRAPSGDTQELLAWFQGAYEEAVGTPYQITKKDAVNVTRHLKSLDRAELQARLLRGLVTDDAWIADTDRSLAVLLSVVNRPALRGTAPKAGKAGTAAPGSFSETGIVQDFGRVPE